VSAQCQVPALISGGYCELAEVWLAPHNVSASPGDIQANDGGAYLALDPPRATGASSGGATPPTLHGVLPVAHARVSASFRYTSGAEPVLRIGNLKLPRQVIEVYSARLEFPTSGYRVPAAAEDGASADDDDATTTTPPCYYTDHDFCRWFHDLKKPTSSPSASFSGGASLIFILWGMALVALIADFHISMLSQWRHFTEIREADRQNVHIGGENRYIRTQVFLRALTSQCVLGTCLRLFFLALPWPFYLATLRTCWDCLDLEAEMAHAIGTVLGLGEPDLSTSLEAAYAQLAAGYRTPGNVSYNAVLSAGGALNASSACGRVWDFVSAGVPTEGGEELTSKGLRPALMATTTRHDPLVCLQQDDYEALLALYPPCTPVPSVPVCHRAPTNTGLLILSASVLIPFVICLLVALGLQLSLRARLKSLDDQTNHGLGTSAKSLVKRATSKNLTASILPVDDATPAEQPPPQQQHNDTAASSFLSKAAARYRPASSASASPGGGAGTEGTAASQVAGGAAAGTGIDLARCATPPA